MTAHPATLDYARPDVRLTRARSMLRGVGGVMRRTPRWAWAALLAVASAFAVPLAARGVWQHWPGGSGQSPDFLWDVYQSPGAFVAAAVFLAGPLNRLRPWELLTAPAVAAAALLAAWWCDPLPGAAFAWQVAAKAMIVALALAGYEWAVTRPRGGIGAVVFILTASAAALIGTRLTLPFTLGETASSHDFDALSAFRNAPWSWTAVLTGGVLFFALAGAASRPRGKLKVLALPAGVLAASVAAGLLHDYQSRVLPADAVASLGPPGVGRRTGGLDRRAAVLVLLDAGPPARQTLYAAAAGERRYTLTTCFGGPTDERWQTLAAQKLLERDGGAAVDELVRRLRREPHGQALVEGCPLLPPEAVRRLAPELLRLAVMSDWIGGGGGAARLLYRAGVPQAYAMDRLVSNGPFLENFPEAFPNAGETAEAWRERAERDPPAGFDAAECDRVLAAAGRVNAWVGDSINAYEAVRGEAWLVSEGTDAFVAGAEAFLTRVEAR